VRLYFSSFKYIYFFCFVTPQFEYLTLIPFFYVTEFNYEDTHITAYVFCR